MVKLDHCETRVGLRKVSRLSLTLPSATLLLILWLTHLGSRLLSLPLPMFSFVLLYVGVLFPVHLLSVLQGTGLSGLPRLAVFRKVM